VEERQFRQRHRRRVLLCEIVQAEAALEMNQLEVRDPPRAAPTTPAPRRQRASSLAAAAERTVDETVELGQEGVVLDARRGEALAVRLGDRHLLRQALGARAGV